MRIVKLVVRYELRLWASLFRWVLRRPVRVGPNGSAFGYAQAITPMLIVFIVVSAIEIPVVELLLPWQTIRYALLAVGVYGLLWMIGLLAAVRVHPHVVKTKGEPVVELRFHADDPGALVAAARRFTTADRR